MVFGPLIFMLPPPPFPFAYAPPTPTGSQVSVPDYYASWENDPALQQQETLKWIVPGVALAAYQKQGPLYDKHVWHILIQSPAGMLTVPVYQNHDQWGVR